MTAAIPRSAWIDTSDAELNPAGCEIPMGPPVGAVYRSRFAELLGNMLEEMANFMNTQSHLFLGGRANLYSRSAAKGAEYPNDH
jgi:hypothetical protein